MNAPDVPSRPLTTVELTGFAQAGQLFALLDSCDAPEVLERLNDLPEEQSVCLYSGDAEEDFAAFAPYLLAVTPELLPWVKSLVEGGESATLVVSDAGTELVRKHFRRLLLVLAPNGEEMYFRFYDPRVLPKFLAVCTDEERRDVFGPLLAFGVVKAGQLTALTEQPGPIPQNALLRPSRNGLFQTRPAHLRAFSEEGEQAFEVSIVEHLRDYHGDLVEGFADVTLVKMVRHGITKARRYGFFSEADLTAFVAIMFEIAPNFDRHSYIQEVLTDPRTLPVQRMEALTKQVPDFVWAEAERRYDSDAWFPESIEVS